MTELLQQHLNRAKQKMKKQADQKRTARDFSVGDNVFLKLQPYVQSTVAVRSNHKLCFKYFCPFPIIAKVGSVAYRLQLPEGSQVHPVFHVSQLKKALPPHRQVSSSLPSDTDSFMTPVKTLDHRWRQKGNRRIRQVLTQWSNLPATELLWEDPEDLRARFPRATAWGQAVPEEEGVLALLLLRPRLIQPNLRQGPRGSPRSIAGSWATNG